jgi:hypothetical protein
MKGEASTSPFFVRYRFNFGTQKKLQILELSIEMVID